MSSLAKNSARANAVLTAERLSVPDMRTACRCQILSFVPMTKTTTCQVQPSSAPLTKRGRKSRKKLEYGTKSSDSDSGSDSAGSQHAHSKPKTITHETCFAQAQPPSNFLTLAAST
eukprot:264698-Pyramimonas_sp.AAC.1